MTKLSQKSLARRACVTYYRRHARGSRVTFKELCEQLGIDYGYARKIKLDYDRTRRKPKKRNTDTPDFASDRSNDG